MVHKGPYHASETANTGTIFDYEKEPANASLCCSEAPAEVIRAESVTDPVHIQTSSRPTRARDNGIKDKDNKSFRRASVLYDGIDLPYLLEELKVRYDLEFVRTPVNERCVFSNATYAGETKVKLTAESYAVSNHVWIVDFYRANNIDFSEPKEGLLMIWRKKWRNAGLGDPQGAFAGLCAVSADKGRNIIAIETNLEARL